MADFFISFTEADKDWAEWIAWQLEDSGFSVLYQGWDFRPGSNFVIEMNRALAESERTLVVMSPAFLGSRFGASEWATTFEKDPTGELGLLIPVRVRACEPPPLLRARVYIDLVPAAGDEAEARRLLVAGLAEGRPKPEQPAAFPGGRAQPEPPAAAPFPVAAHRQRVEAGVAAQRAAGRVAADERRAGGKHRVVGLPSSLVVGGYFKDRVEPQRRVKEHLAGDTKLVEITGRAGIGKSALAAKIAADFEADPADGAGAWAGFVYIGARAEAGEITAERIVLDLATLVGGEGREAMHAAWSDAGRPISDRLRTALDRVGGKVLVVLDHLDDELDEAGKLPADLETFFAVLLTHPADVRVLVTSRRPMAGDPGRFAASVALDEGLPADEAAAFLRDLDEDDAAGLLTALDEELAQLVAAVHGMPRALIAVRSRLAEDAFLTPEGLVASLGDQADVVEALVGDQLRGLDEDATRVVRALAVFRRPMPPEAIDYVVAPSAPGLSLLPVINRLKAQGLVDVDRRSRTAALHSIDRDIAYLQIPEDGPEGRAALERRAADWHASQRLPDEDWNTPDDVAPQIEEFRLRLRAGDADDAARVLVDIDDFLVWRGWVRRARAMHEEVAGLATDGAVLPALTFGRALVYYIAGPADQAPRLFERALQLAIDAGDRATEALALSHLGDAARMRGDVDEAMETLARAATIQHEIGDREGWAHSTLRLGLAAAYGGKLAAAREAAQQLSSVPADDDLTHGRALDLTSLVDLIAGRYEDAVRHADEAMARYEASEVVEATGYLLNVQGLAHLANRNYSAASERLELARADGERAGIPRVSAIAAYNLAVCHWLTGLVAEAAAAVEQALRDAAGNDETALAAAQTLQRALAAAAAGRGDEAQTALAAAADAASANPDLCARGILERLAAQVEPSPG